MILATYQADGYRTYKNKRFKSIKKLLGIPENKDIYWCIPANSMEQFVIGTICAGPNMPQKLVIFETDDYKTIDGVKWDYLVGKNGGEEDTETEADDSILKIDYPERAEYIVTEIPEDAFEVDANFANLALNYNNNTYPEEVMEALSCFQDELTDTLNSNLLMDVAEGLMTQIKFTLNDANGEDIHDPREMIRKGYMLYAAYFASTVYSAALYYLGYASYEMDIRVPLNLDELVTLFNMSICTDYSSIEALANDYRRAITSIYRFVFYAPYSDKKVYPNDPCPCGSGLKYKNCCKDGKRVSTSDVVKIMSEDTPDYELLEDGEYDDEEDEYDDEIFDGLSINNIIDQLKKSGISHEKEGEWSIRINDKKDIARYVINFLKCPLIKKKEANVANLTEEPKFLPGYAMPYNMYSGKYNQKKIPTYEELNKNLSENGYMVSCVAAFDDADKKRITMNTLLPWSKDEVNIKVFFKNYDEKKVEEVIDYIKNTEL